MGERVREGERKRWEQRWGWRDLKRSLEKGNEEEREGGGEKEEG